MLRPVKGMLLPRRAALAGCGARRAAIRSGWLTGSVIKALNLTHRTGRSCTARH